MVSTMDKKEIEVSKILLQLPSLIADCEILRLLPFTWASKKRRTATASSSSPDNNVFFIACPNCSPKTPLSFSNHNNIEIKRETDHVNLLCLDEFVKEEPKRKNKIVLPDLNIPLTPPEEEAEEDRFQVADRGRVFADVAMRKKAMAAEARRRRIQILRSKKSRIPRSHLARGGAQVVTVVPMLPTYAFVSMMSVCESDSTTQSLL